MNMHKQLNRLIFILTILFSAQSSLGMSHKEFQARMDAHKAELETQQIEHEAKMKANREKHVQKMKQIDLQQATVLIVSFYIIAKVSGAALVALGIKDWTIALCNHLDIPLDSLERITLELKNNLTDENIKKDNVGRYIRTGAKVAQGLTSVLIGIVLYSAANFVNSNKDLIISKREQELDKIYSEE